MSTLSEMPIYKETANAVKQAKKTSDKWQRNPHFLSYRRTHSTTFQMNDTHFQELYEISVAFTWPQNYQADGVNFAIYHQAWLALKPLYANDVRYWNWWKTHPDNRGYVSSSDSEQKAPVLLWSLQIARGRRLCMHGNPFLVVLLSLLPRILCFRYFFFCVR